MLSSIGHFLHLHNQLSTRVWHASRDASRVLSARHDMAQPVVYGRRRDGDDVSSERSSPSFRLMSPPRALHGKGIGGDSSYDTSIASLAPSKDVASDLETDVESDTEESALPSFVARMRKQKPASTELFLLSDDETGPIPPQDARKSRMDRLRALAQQRAAPSSPEDEPPAEQQAGLSRARASTSRSPSPPPHAVDVHSDLSDVDIHVPQQPKPRGLSRKEQREMHSMSAKLRRENGAGLARPEPKRYQLSELLSRIEHTASPAPPNAMHSSDPVESSSTPDTRHAKVPSHTSPSIACRTARHDDARTRKKWAWIERQQQQQQQQPNTSTSNDSDSDLEVVSLGHHKPPLVHFHGSSRRDARRESADQSLTHLAVFPRTPRKKRIATDEYRSPNTHGPDAPAMSDGQMNAAAHTFGLAAQQQAGTLPPPLASPHHASLFPPMLGLDELNATVLKKVYMQNAETTAKKSHPKHDEMPDLQPPAPAQAHYQALSPSPSPAPAESPASVHSGSEKENAPPTGSQRSASHYTGEHAPLSELPVPDMPDEPPAEGDEPDLGEFFAPTQPAQARQPTPSNASLHRTGSDTSVLAQFFEHGTQEPQNSGSLDIFANERRSGPVGGMTQFFEPTQASSVSKSQEAMPPPTSTSRSADAFAALRRAEQADAAAPLSPDMLPSLDPSLAEHGEEVWREAQRMQKQRNADVLYLNEDGFFTQTKPAESALPSMPDFGLSGEGEEEPTPRKSPIKSRSRSWGNSAFVFGEAEESEEEDAHGEHGGLAGVFSDKDSDASENEEGSDDDADLSSLLDDESDEDGDEKDEAALRKYMQQRHEDDEALQALHERATKGLLRHRRRGRAGDDGLADLLDEDADEDELRRRIQAPRFTRKRRCIEGDGMDALAARDDAQAFVKTYNETHTGDDEQHKYEFLDTGDVSSEDERVSAHTVREHILRERQTRRDVANKNDVQDGSDDDAIQLKLTSRRQKRTSSNCNASDDEIGARVLFQSGKVDEASLPQAVLEKRARLLEEYSHEPQWQDTRGGRDQLDRRRRSSSSSKREFASTPSHSLTTTSSAPSVLRHHILRREAQFP